MIDKEATRRLREQLDNDYVPSRKERERRATGELRKQVADFNAADAMPEGRKERNDDR